MQNENQIIEATTTPNTTIVVTPKKNAVKRPKVKGVNDTPKGEKKGVTASLNAVNISDLKKRIAAKQIEKTQKDREHIYVYPAELIGNENSAKGKKFRQSLRNKMQRFSNNFFFEFTRNDAKALKTLKAEFSAFYKENFRTNDFSLKSLTASSDAKKVQDISDMLQIIRTIK